MFDIERFLEEKLNPLFRIHYALWVLWWPLWRKLTARKIVKKWEEYNLVEEGHSFLDFGCGTGEFSLCAAGMVDEDGKVFALDYFPRQLEIVQKKAAKAGITNIETIHSTGDTGLPEESIDVIWMCDVLHEVKERRKVLKELHRVLKRDGQIAIYDGMGDLTLNYTNGLFSLIGSDDKLYRFEKII